MQETLKKYKSIFKIGVPIMLGLLIAAGLNLSYQIIIVSGDSMKPTLKNGQVIIIDKTNFKIDSGDIVVFTLEGERVIKRVFGIPGDTIYLSEDGVIINGITIRPYEYDGEEMSYTLKDDEFFVMGDNQFESADSRIFGPITIDQIIGKMIQ